MKKKNRSRFFDYRFTKAEILSFFFTAVDTKLVIAALANEPGSHSALGQAYNAIHRR